LGRKTVSGIILVLLTISMVSLAFNIQPAKASLPVHNIDAGLDYATIQEAINAPETLNGHTIYVEAETYYENEVVNKSINLIGESKENTIIDGNGTGIAVLIQADNVTVKGFTIQYSGIGIAIMGNETKRYVGNNVSENVFRNNAEAILLINSDSNFIVNNSLYNNGFGVQLGMAIVSYSSNNNMITGNTITSSVRGIWLHNSSHNVISRNIITNITGEGIITGTPYVPSSPKPPVFSNNTISYNVITNCTIGLSLAYGPRGSSSYSGGNNITGNIVQFNELGVYIFDEGNNTIVANTIKNNVFGMFLHSKNNLLRANAMFKNVYNLMEIELLYNDIDASNTISGKSVYHFFNQTNLNINPSTYPDMGFLALKNCSNVIIKNMMLLNNGFGIALEGCTNITIAGTTIQDNIIGISAFDSFQIYIGNNTVKNNLHGVSMFLGEHITVEDNLIVNNTNRRILQIMNFQSLQAMPFLIRGLIYDRGLGLMICYPHASALFATGILLYGAENSTFVNNTIVSNENGIYLSRAVNNVFKNNNMTDNVYNFGIDISSLIPPEWIVRPPDPPQISPYLMNDVDTSNTVNGKPIYWWINRHDRQVPTNAGYVVLVNCTNMMIKDLVLQNNTQSMLLVGVSNTTISNNVITGNKYGINLLSYAAKGHTSINNTIVNNDIGIKTNSPYIMIAHNFFDSNLIGLYVYDNVTISKNMIANSVNPPLEKWVFGYPVHGIDTEWLFYGNGVGIILQGANTTARDNTIQDNYYGISIAYGCGGNKIYHNNFINNTEHVIRGLPGRPPVTLPPNTWDNGYPSGGNYWSDYAGIDFHGGSDQNETGSDGIGDIPFVIDENNVDRYPLMGPFNSFNASIGYSVDVVSNSTIGDFRYFESNSTIIMHISNMTVNQTVGFCRLTIPHDVMYPPYTVKVNDTIINFQTIYENYTERISIIYFTYEHSKLEITIIPEYPSMTIMLLLSATLVTTALTKGSFKEENASKNPKHNPIFKIKLQRELPNTPTHIKTINNCE